MEKINPFIYGRSLKPKEFFDRRIILSAIWDRILNGESSAVTGEPQIGKTSLLNKLMDIESFKDAKGLDEKEASKFKFLFFDSMILEAEDAPNRFWRKMLENLIRELRNSPEGFRLVEEFYQSFELFEDKKDFFIELGRKGICVVLMIDEFEVMLEHPNFRTPDFYGQLRHLANLTDGLVVIAASRLNVSELNRKGRKILDVGSPFFNNWREFRLKAFDRDIAEKFLMEKVPEWDENMRSFVIALSGTHPALIQAVSSLLWERIASGLEFRKAGEDLLERLGETLRDHFDTVWERFSAPQKVAAFLIGVEDILELPWGKHAKELGYLKRRDILDIMAEKDIQKGIKELVDLGFIVKDHDDSDLDIKSRAFLFWLKDKLGEEDFNPAKWAKGADIGLKNQKSLYKITDKIVNFLKRIPEEMFWEVVMNFIFPKF